MLRLAATRARQLARAAPALTRGFAAEAEAQKSGGSVRALTTLIVEQRSLIH